MGDFFAASLAATGTTLPYTCNSRTIDVPLFSSGLNVNKNVRQGGIKWCIFIYFSKENLKVKILVTTRLTKKYFFCNCVINRRVQKIATKRTNIVQSRLFNLLYKKTK